MGQKIKIILCLIFSILCVFGEPTGEHPTSVQEEAPRRLTYSDAVILGLVEGLTEFLPISSTGHLILTNSILGLDTEEAITDSEGNAILVPDGASELRPYTTREAAYAFVIVIQAGAIAAVLILYRKTLLSIPLGFLGKNETGKKLGLNLLSAFLPAAVIGLALNDRIESVLGHNVYAVGAALVAGAVAILLVEHWRQRRSTKRDITEEGPQLHELSMRQCILIGLFQCVAMWPGTSRSMATIIGGYLVGLSPKRAAEFSFLLGFITLSAASGYKLVFDGSDMLSAFSFGPVFVGCIVASASAAIAVKWLVGYLGQHGLGVFAWYRIAIAIAVFLFLG